MKEVIIKPSDEGGNIVLWPVKKYEKEAWKQLKDTQCYKKLTFNPLTKFQAEVCTIVREAIDKEILTMAMFTD